MRLDVYDTYATLPDGTRMHFDVLLPEGDDVSIAESRARQWLKQIGLQADVIRLDRCRFCHSEAANPETENDVERLGYAILQMEGCPTPFV